MRGLYPRDFDKMYLNEQIINCEAGAKRYVTIPTGTIQKLIQKNLIAYNYSSMMKKIIVIYGMFTQKGQEKLLGFHLK